MDFIHSILRANAAVSADGDEVIDLPVNALSVVLIHLSPLNDTGTITAYALLEGLLIALGNVRITHKGSAVVDGNGHDLAMMAMAYHGVPLWQSNAVETNNERRSLVIPILFGRRAYMQSECFPETKKGELQMTLTLDIAATGFDGLRRSVETIELPGASPQFVEKKTTLAQTFAATGQNDIELPIGNVIRACLMYGNTGYAGAAPAPTLGQLEVLRDNRQIGYTSTDYEVSRAIMGLMGVPFPPDFRHIHSVNAAGAGQEDTQQPEVGASLDDNYTLLHFDPTHDDEYSLETAGAGRVNVRATAETADAARAMPVERMAAEEFLS